MKRLPVLLATAGTVALAACSSDFSPVAAPEPLLSANSRAAKDILFKMKDNASDSERQAAEEILGRYAITRGSSLVDGKVSHSSIGRANGRSEEQIAAELQATGAVDYAEVDELLSPAYLPWYLLPSNDPLLTDQWHHTTINSAAAWDHSTGSAAVKVAICDTGVDRFHPDLTANVPDAGWNIVDNLPGGGPNPLSPLGHGTRVAGVVGAVGNNAAGVAGVNWASNILPIRVTNNPTGGAQLSTLVACVDYARLNGAKVVNVSYSGIAFSAAANTAGLALMDAGGLLFVAAANDNTYYRKSTNHPGIVVVAATDQSDLKATFSNWGPFVDITGPGVGIMTTAITDIYAAGTGTSFSSPMAAGLAALIWSKNPTLTPQSVQNIIFRTARDLGNVGYDETFGYGRIDAGAALAFAATATNPVAPPVNSGPGKGRGK